MIDFVVVVMVFQVLDTPVIFFFFFKSVLSLLFVLGDFCCSVSRFTDSFLCYPHSAVEGLPSANLHFYLPFFAETFCVFFSCVQCAY